MATIYKSRPSMVRISNLDYHDSGVEADHRDEAKQMAKSMKRYYVIVKYSNIFRKVKYLIMVIEEKVSRF
jgi:hypothetical protein